MAENNKKMEKSEEIKKNVCPVSQLLKVISSRWTNEILWHLGKNNILRFGELKRELRDISTKVLTERLRMLEKNGIIHRDQQPTIPPTVKYNLTEMGQDIFYALNSLQNVAIKWDFTKK